MYLILYLFSCIVIGMVWCELNADRLRAGATVLHSEEHLEQYGISVADTENAAIVMAVLVWPLQVLSDLCVWLRF